MGLLKGKKALVSGVANKNSIAWAIAQSLHREGAEIAFFCLENSTRRVTKLARQVDSNVIIPCDVQDDENIKAAFDDLGKAFDGKLDILVHSIAFANIDDLGGEFIKVTRSGWNLALEISAYSLVAFARYARPMMKAAGGGSIFTLTFGGGENVVPGYNIMGIAKAALNMSVEYLAYDLGPENIRVNAISSGPVKTLSSMVIEDFEVGLQLQADCSPLLRNTTSEDLGGTAVYLASDLSSGVTGAILDVDCGLHTLRPPAVKHRRWENGRRLLNR